MELSGKTITSVIRYCNRDLVPDPTFDPAGTYHSDWFVKYFSFIGDTKVEAQLGDAFYHARFVYKLMSALRLPLAKHKGIVKFQIVQYASICEAVLDMAISRFFKEDAEEKFSVSELTKVPNALAVDIKITQGNTNLLLCKAKKKRGDLKRTRIDFKTEYAVGKGLLSQATKDSFDRLYNLRNNIHILKAADSQYIPKLSEAKEAFTLMQTLVGEIKTYYKQNPNS